jgi:hypothetical protein
MNKRFLFLAFVAFAVFSCSDDKSPSREEICRKIPVERDCLIGEWSFKGVVYQNDKDISHDCGDQGVLVFAVKNGDYYYRFKGGVYSREVTGAWFIEGNTITIEDLELQENKTGTIEVANSGNTMTVNATDSRSVFADCDTDKLEKFIFIR